MGEEDDDDEEPEAAEWCENLVQDDIAVDINDCGGYEAEEEENNDDDYAAILTGTCSNLPWTNLKKLVQYVLCTQLRLKPTTMPMKITRDTDHTRFTMVKMVVCSTMKGERLLNPVVCPEVLSLVLSFSLLS